MAQESIVWYSEEWNGKIEEAEKELTEVVNEEFDDGEWDDKTLGDLLVRYLTHMAMMVLGEELFNLTFEEINNFTDEETKELYDKLEAIFNDETKTKEFFPKG